MKEISGNFLKKMYDEFEKILDKDNRDNELLLNKWKVDIWSVKSFIQNSDEEFGEMIFRHFLEKKYDTYTNYDPCSFWDNCKDAVKLKEKMENDPFQDLDVVEEIIQIIEDDSRIFVYDFDEDIIAEFFWEEN